MSRQAWTALSDDALLVQCDVDTYRASGPGGQKRNKTSSAVRLRHRPSGLIVIAEESRSQHENKAKALQRLRRALYLNIREQPPELLDWQPCHSPRDPRFWPAAGCALDVLAICEARVSTTAQRLGVSTAQLVEFLQLEPRLWQEANRLRMLYNHKPLRS